MPFELHPQLHADCYHLGFINDNTVLLHKNALVPWFIVVPNTQCIEIFKLEPSQQQQVQNSINQIAYFIDHHFSTDKLNIATIGNIVPQLHIHIIGRYVNDFCWPNPVWGQQDSSPYHPNELLKLKREISQQVSAFVAI